MWREVVHYEEKLEVRDLLQHVHVVNYCSRTHPQNESVNESVNESL